MEASERVTSMRWVWKQRTPRKIPGGMKRGAEERGAFRKEKEVLRSQDQGGRGRPCCDHRRVTLDTGQVRLAVVGGKHRMLGVWPGGMCHEGR